MVRVFTVLLGVCCALVLLTSAVRAEAPPRPQPDVIYRNGNIYPLGSGPARVEAIGVANGIITAVGTQAELYASRGPQTRIVDLRGRTVLPGLIDAHGHMAALGSFGLGRLDLGTAHSFEDVVAAVAARVAQAKPGEWILGGRWDQESWPGKALPHHAALSAVSPNNPVWLVRVDGHTGLANAAAMKRAGVDAETATPSGGDLLRAADGTPTGVFVDNATRLIEDHIDAPALATVDLLRKAQEMCLEVGLTGVHDPGVSPDDIAAYRQLQRDNELQIRAYLMVSSAYAVDWFRQNPPVSDRHLAIRACKVYIDGAMGSRGAWLLEPYADRPRDDNNRPYTGIAVNPAEFVRLIAEDGLQRGYQVCTHAIGDRGNRVVLDMYKVALDRRPRPDARFRIEHAQLLTAQDVPRFAQLGVIASVQPTHCTSDMRWVATRIGPERAKWAYAWASLVRSGAVVASGSDFPVESHNPWFGIHAAVTRQDASQQPPGGWHAEQRLTREEALKSFTQWAAYAEFAESYKGTLEAGKVADFIVLDRDVMTCPIEEIRGTRVLQTVIDGKVVYRRAESD